MFVAFILKFQVKDCFKEEAAGISEIDNFIILDVSQFTSNYSLFRVRIDPNMNITILRKPSNSHLMNSYSTYLMVRQADQSYAGRNK